MLIVVAALAFALMEPLTYAVHRWVMHGPGMSWHRSHHAARGRGGWERNDRFPVLFAALTLLVVSAGVNLDGLGVLAAVGAGASVYGLLYVVVHDGFIHGRFPTPIRGRWADRLAAAHAVHHRSNGEPYGMLWPVLPPAAASGERRERVPARPAP